MRFRLCSALAAALSACVVLFGAVAVASGAPAGQGCNGTHNSDTGHGANQGGPYDNTCNGSPSGNGNGKGQATGKPCAGCVGNADDKNPGFAKGKGQMPNGSDHNAGYECDRNHGIGRTNPAHTGCRASTTTPPPSSPPPKTCPNGQPMAENGNCGGGNNENQPPATTSQSTPATPQQAVLGERQSSPAKKTAPGSHMVLGKRAGGKTPSATPSRSAVAPASAQETHAAATNRKLPFTGTDMFAVLLAGALALLAGVGLRRLAAHRA